MAKPVSKLDWVPSGNPSLIIEPTSGLKTSGYSAGERPTNQNHNWIFWNTDQWINYLEGVTDSLLSDIGSVTGLSVVNSARIDDVESSLPHYASNGDFYSDSGAADAYVLSATESKTPINAYSDGDRIRFIPDNTNTGASTVNVNSLGVKSIVNIVGDALSGGEIALGTLIELVYNSSLGKFVQYITPSIDAIRTSIEADTNAGETLTANVTPIPFSNKVKDVLGEWNGSQFTPINKGTYLYTGFLNFSATINEVAYYVGGVLKKAVLTSPTNNRGIISFTVDLEAGQVTDLRSVSNTTTLQSTDSDRIHWIKIVRIF